MSSNLPPSGPPSGPPGGPGWGPPTGPPPPPPYAPGGPETLASGGGGPIPPGPPPSGAPGGRGRRKGLLVGGGLLGLLAVGGGAFAVYQVGFATGPQPAEALPASTVGYVSVDLDPSGKQKLEALRVLNKFPAFADQVGVEEGDDLRQRFFEYVQDEGGCPDLSWKDDVEPWLGDRFAVAAVDVGDATDDESGVAAVVVAQVDDGDAATEGLDKITGCAEGDDAGAAVDVDGGWAVLAEDQEVLDAVTSARDDGTLADDDDFQRWTGETGDAGILTAYAAPEAGELLGQLAELGNALGGVACAQPVLPDPTTGAPAPLPPECTDTTEQDDPPASSAFDDFPGAALTVRFDDGGLELETATGVQTLDGADGGLSDRGGDVVASLPEDTAIALGAGFEDGWFDVLTGGLETYGGGGFDIEGGLSTFEEQTGLSLPEDAETLFGDASAVAVSGDLDAATLEEGPAGQPIGLKVEGDPDAVAGVMDQLLEDPGLQEVVGEEFGYATGDGEVAASFSQSWRDQLLDDGGLGETDDYRDVVAGSDDAAGVLFVNFDAGNWLTSVLDASDAPQEVRDNLEPLAAAGLSGSIDGDVSHGVLRITTD